MPDERRIVVDRWRSAARTASRPRRYHAVLTALRQFRLVALAEGASFLVLLFVAMPLKYLFGLPLAVRIVGSVHGALFIVFVVALIRAGTARPWPFHRWLLAFVSAIVPFGTFFFDRWLRREIASLPSEAAVLRR
jgi:integral membrane protein